ncbi:hypothetical protein [Roseicella sp. DB1501]|uniref:hypothetical protein n=1 Tax=Roseicella sp. DB1501 TaxID=2730925 RepID=UPI0014909D55|nr:hypothetical protein [Roseicella sp. DB1501]NOG69788.1 hypothetical protein [Roseicella sp. DB1501]
MARMFEGKCCAAAGCERQAHGMTKGRGPFCQMHGQRVHRYGHESLTYSNRNPRPPVGLAHGVCGVDGLVTVKPRIRVKAVMQRALENTTAGN